MNFCTRAISLLSLAMLAQIAVAAEHDSAAAPAEPAQVVGSAAQILFDALDAKRDYYRDNLGEFYMLLDEILAQRFDTRYAGKQVLGRKHWTAATDEQRDAFVEAFYGFLIRTYAKTVLEFNQNAVSIAPEPRYSKDRDKALVQTTIRLAAGDPARVEYALRSTPSGWLIYDVRIDGVSYLQNYRSQFDAEISAQGIDAVVLRLQQEAEAATS